MTFHHLCCYGNCSTSASFKLSRGCWDTREGKWVGWNQEERAPHSEGQDVWWGQPVDQHGVARGFFLARTPAWDLLGRGTPQELERTLIPHLRLSSWIWLLAPVPLSNPSVGFWASIYPF